MFEINDKVVCVDDSACPFNRRHPPFKMGEICSVKGTSRGWDDKYGDHLTLLIVGHPNLFNPSHGDLGWRATRFRKLTDIQAENRAKAKEKKEKIHEPAQ